MPDCFTGGFVQTNGYLQRLPDGSQALIDAPAGIAAWLKAQGVTPVALLLTHQHYDHVEDAAAVAAMGVPVYAWAPYAKALTLEEMVQAMGLPVVVEPYSVDHLLEGKDHLELGGGRIGLSHVPGHAPDSVTFHFPADGRLFSGDTLFAGGIGRTDLPGGSYPTLLAGIRGKLYTLPETTGVFPGHGPATTIGEERAHNDFVRG